MTRTSMTDRLDRTPLRDYLGAIHTDRLLTAEEERNLAFAIQKGDKEARSRLICSNLRLVVTIARDYVGRGLSLEDLVGEGNVGLIRAAEDFDPEFGTRFSTYASYWIKQAIRWALTNTGATIRVPAHMFGLLTRWRRAEQALARSLGGPPGADLVAAEMGLRRGQLLLVEDGLRASRLGCDGLDEDGADRVAGIAFVPEMSPEDALVLEEALEDLACRLARLDARERTILTLRYGLGGQMPHTLKAVGKKLGVTREWVRKIELKAIVKLAQMTPVAPGEAAPIAPEPPVRRRQKASPTVLPALQIA